MAGVGKQVVDLEALVRVDPQCVEVELQPPLLRQARIEVHHREDDVRAVLGALAVGDELVVVDAVEAQAAVALQRGVLLPDAVHAADEVRQALRPLELPVADLILLRVEVLLAALFQWLALLEFEGGPVDPVAGPERGCKHEPLHERRPPARLKLLGQDVRRVRPQVRTEELGDAGLGELGEVLLELPLRGAPREVRVGLGEAELRQTVHDLRPGERLGQEDHVRVFGLDRFDQPLPESERLGVRVVDPEDAHAVADPEEDDALQLLPQLGPGLGLEVERIDVLVLLGRVLCVLDGAVGAVPEPLRMLLDEGVVRRALVGEVQGHLHAVFTGPRHEAFEVFDRPELRVDGLVASLLAPDGPGASRIMGLGPRSVVLALAMRVADGVDGREVDHVEVHPGHVFEPLLGVGERPVATELRRA